MLLDSDYQQCQRSEITTLQWSVKNPEGFSAHKIPWNGIIDLKRMVQPTYNGK